ncbi:MAG: ankyrin repeat domain-containing protein [Thermodesulfobacteriota bacterium]
MTTPNDRLLQAVRNRRLDWAREALENGADPNARHSIQFSHTALMIAAQNNDTEMLNLLLEHGADVNGRNFDQSTALHEAAKNGSLEAAQLLVNRGARRDIEDGYGQTPLNEAKRRKRHEVANWLRSIDATWISNGTKLHGLLRASSLPLASAELFFVSSPLRNPLSMCGSARLQARS